MNKLLLNHCKPFKFILIILVFSIDPTQSYGSKNLQWEEIDLLHNSSSGHIELINREDDLTCYDQITPLMEIPLYGHTEIIRRMVETNAQNTFRLQGICFEIKSPTEISMILIEANSDEIADFLIWTMDPDSKTEILKLANIKRNINTDEVTPIHCSVLHGQTEIVSLLIQVKIKMDSIDEGDRYAKFSTICPYEIAGKIQKQLVSANVDISSRMGASILITRQGQVEYMRYFFLDNDEDYTQNKYYDPFSIWETHLEYAAREKSSGVVKLLMLADGQLIKSKLDHAIISGDIDSVKELASSDIEYWGSCTPFKKRALALATLTREMEIFHYLCDIWNVQTDPSFLETIIDWACFLEPTNFMEHLCDKIIRVKKYTMFPSDSFKKNSFEMIQTEIEKLIAEWTCSLTNNNLFIFSLI